MKRNELVRNAADETQVDNATRVTSARAEMERDDLRFLMSTPQGRREYWRLLSRCKIYDPSFVGEQPLTMAFNEGERNIGLWLSARLVEKVPNLYLTMRDEASRENT